MEKQDVPDFLPEELPEGGPKELEKLPTTEQTLKEFHMVEMPQRSPLIDEHVMKAQAFVMSNVLAALSVKAIQMMGIDREALGQKMKELAEGALSLSQEMAPVAQAELAKMFASLYERVLARCEGDLEKAACVMAAFSHGAAVDLGIQEGSRAAEVVMAFALRERKERGGGGLGVGLLPVPRSKWIPKCVAEAVEKLAKG